MFEEKQLQMANNLCEKLIGDIRYDDADISAPPRSQTLRILVQLKSIFLNNPAYTAFRFLGIAALFMQNTRYGSG